MRTAALAPPRQPILSKWLLTIVFIITYWALNQPAQAGNDAFKARKNLVGAWIGNVTVLEPQTSESFPTIFTFHRDKTVLETKTTLTANSPLGPLLATPGHGAWKKIGPKTFAISFKFYVQGGQGNPYFEGELVGINNINYTATIGESGKDLNATWTSALVDPGGTVLFEGSGTFTGTRIEVEGL